MFESLQANGGRSLVARLMALAFSLFLHGVILLVVILLPLIFLNVLPQMELLTILVAAPLPPPPPPPPAPPQTTAARAPAAGPPIILDFLPPDKMPIGIPVPNEPPPSIGIGNLPTGIPGAALVTGNTGILGSMIVAAPAPPVPPRPAPPAPTKMMVRSTLQESKLIKRVVPDYPNLAKIAHVEDSVLMEVTVDEEGNVTDVRVIKGHPLLTEAAVRAVRQWKYSPTVLNGEPVQVVSNVTVIFRLK